MKTSGREAFLLVVLYLLIISGVYYVFFYMPNSNEINQLQESIDSTNAQIDDASIMLLRMQGLTNRNKTLGEEFADISGHLPEDVSDADILRRIEHIIKPYTDTLSIEFAVKAAGPAEDAKLTSVQTVHLHMNTSYDNLQKIISAFEDEDIANRIVHFTLSRYYSDLEETGGRDLQIGLSIDYLLR